MSSSFVYASSQNENCPLPTKTFWLHTFSLTSYYVPSPWSRCQGNKNEWNSRGLQPSRGDRWMYNSSNVLSAIREIQSGIQRGHNTAWRHGGRLLESSDWTGLWRMNRSGQGREVLPDRRQVSAKAQRQECQGLSLSREHTTRRWSSVSQGDSSHQSRTVLAAWSILSGQWNTQGDSHICTQSFLILLWALMWLLLLHLVLFCMAVIIEKRWLQTKVKQKRKENRIKMYWA